MREISGGITELSARADNFQTYSIPVGLLTQASFYSPAFPSVS